MKKGKKRKIFNLYNFAVVLCLVVICGSLYILMGPESFDDVLTGAKNKVTEVFTDVSNTIGEWTNSIKKDEKKEENKNTNIDEKNIDETKNGVDTKKLEAVETTVGEDGNITISGALDAAVRQFKELGENVSSDDLKLQKITRDSIEYFYVTSTQNSIEIKIQGGKVTRINSATLED